MNGGTGNLEWLRNVPWTQVRIAWAILMATAAIIVDMSTDWTIHAGVTALISVEFIASAGQWIGQRATNWSPEQQAQAEQIRNGAPAPSALIEERRQVDEWDGEFAG